mmetsp:Transcript_86492/g.253150  ORF Transcript_86492/g.253150 Transcript_86492/m.253150 type:complete len:283 (-) Transcript_86492:971-1819(-)
MRLLAACRAWGLLPGRLPRHARVGCPTDGRRERLRPLGRLRLPGRARRPPRGRHRARRARGRALPPAPSVLRARRGGQGGVGDGDARGHSCSQGGEGQDRLRPRARDLLPRGRPRDRRRRGGGGRQVAAGPAEAEAKGQRRRGAAAHGCRAALAREPLRSSGSADWKQQLHRALRPGDVAGRHRGRKGIAEGVGPQQPSVGLRRCRQGRRLGTLGRARSKPVSWPWRRRRRGVPARRRGAHTGPPERHSPQQGAGILGGVGRGERHLGGRGAGDPGPRLREA